MKHRRSPTREDVNEDTLGFHDMNILGRVCRSAPDEFMQPRISVYFGAHTTLIVSSVRLRLNNKQKALHITNTNRTWVQI